MTDDRNDGSPADRAQQNARDCQDVDVRSVECPFCRAEVGQPCDQGGTAIRNLNGAHGSRIAAALRAADVIGDMVAKRQGAWDGPFKVAKDLTFADDITPDNLVQVNDAAGAPFAYVAVGDTIAVGNAEAAKARATRIAEALNRDQQMFERGLADGAQLLARWQDESGDPFPWMVESRGVNMPHFVVTLTGECWWDIERNLADARQRLHHTAPPRED